MHRLVVYRIAIPFVTPFWAAGRRVATRHLIVVCHEADGVRGWGEAAPWPGQTVLDADATWRALTSAAAWSAPDDERPPSRGDAAQAALEQAAFDHSARTAAEPVWRRWNGEPYPISACAAVGLHDNIDALVADVAGLVERGYRAIKLKIEPGRDVEPFDAVRSAFPRLRLAVDANASYPEIATSLIAIAGRSPTYIEQPFPVGHDHLAATLRSTSPALVVADEDIRGDADARRVVQSGAADVVTIKLGRVGVAAAERIIRWARTEGIPLKASGLFETSVGKAHTLALATAPEVQFVDFSPTAEHLRDDIVFDPWELAGGDVQPRTAPGIGVSVDEERLAALATDIVAVNGPETRSVEKCSMEEVADAAEHE